MKRSHILALVPAVALASQPATPIRVGERLPELRGEFLTGREAILPQAAGGRIALLLLGFTYQSRFPVEAWAANFRGKYSSDPRVTFYEVPMISGMARLAKWFIDSGMRRGTPKTDYEHVITVYRGADSWKHRVGFVGPDAAYLLLLDRSGKVAWTYQGAFDEATFQTLSQKIADLVN